MRDIGLAGSNWVAAAINDNSEIVGYDGTNAFLYANGSVTDLGMLKGFHTQAFGINSKKEVVGNSKAPGNHGFLYSNGLMYDLNDLLIPGSGWVIQDAVGINDAGQIAATGTDPAGLADAFLLNPISPGWLNTIVTTPLQKTYANCPVKDPTKDSLIVITHGWQPNIENLGFPQPDLSWIETMSNSVRNYLINNGINNWQIYGYKWINNAWKWNPSDALANAAQEGHNLAGC